MDPASVKLPRVRLAIARADMRESAECDLVTADIESKSRHQPEEIMDAFKLLFTSDVGLASLAVIAFMIVMAAYLYFHVKKLMKESPGKQGWD